MNRCTIFALLALVATAAASPLAEVDPMEDIAKTISSPNDDEETKLLTGKLENFRGFCIESRDKVFEDMKKNADQSASAIFNIFMQTAKEIGEATAATANKATIKLGNQLLESDSRSSNELEAEASEADKLIQAGQREIAQSDNRVMKVISAFKNIFIAMSATVRGQVEMRMNTLAKIAKELSLEGSFATVCAKVGTYEAMITEKFEAFAAAIDKNSKLSLSDVPCATSTKIVLLGQVCNTAALLRGPTSMVYNLFKLFRGAHPNQFKDFETDEPTAQVEAREN